MPYRTLARNEHAEQDAAEIAAIARQSRVRVMRVGAALAGVFALVLGSAVAAASNGQEHKKLHCHKVIVEYEDSIHSDTAPPPPAIYTSCEWRER
jgi:hypothetical protein